MRDKDGDIQVNTKHVKLRLVLFILAVVIAVGAIGYGVSSLGKKAPGYYRVEANADEELIRLSRSLDFEYKFQGSSAEINAELRQLQALYGASLRRCSRLLDAESTYTGVINPAEINANLGRELQLGEELFEVLTDAWEKTQEGKGYNLFAGPLYAEWNSILILADPEPFDPTADAGEAERLARLAEMVNDPSNFTFEVVDEARHAVRFDVSEALLTLLRDYELDCPILDLGLLHDAWLLRLIARELEAQGYDNGYLTAASGVTVSLSGHSGGEYCLYGFDGKYVEPAAVLPVEGGTAFSLFRAFAMEGESFGYYAAETAEGALLRHPYVPASGEYADVLLSSGVLDPSGDPVRAVYVNICLQACPDRAAVFALAEGETRPVAVTLQTDEPQTVHANATAFARLRDGDYGWKIAEM